MGVTNIPFIDQEFIRASGKMTYVRSFGAMIGGIALLYFDYGIPGTVTGIFGLLVAFNYHLLTNNPRYASSILKNFTYVLFSDLEYR